MKQRQGVWKYLYGVAKGKVYMLVLAMMGILLSTASTLMVPQILRFTVDSIIGGEASILDGYTVGMSATTLLLIAAGLAILTSVLFVIFNFIYRYYSEAFAENVLKRLRDKLFKHILFLPYSWHGKNQTGDIVQRCTLDTEVVKNFLRRQLPEASRIVFQIAWALVFIILIDFRFALVSFVSIPTVLLVTRGFYNVLGKRFLEADENEGELSAAILENLNGVRVVRAFGREAYEMESFTKKNNHFCDIWIRLSKLMGIYWSVGAFICFLQVLVVVIMGVLMSASGTLSVGSYLAVVYYNISLIWPLRHLGRILSEMSKCSISLSRLKEINDAVVELDEGTKTTDMNGDIVFDNVSFLVDNTEILKNISFEIKGGTSLGIIGPVGSGKTTIVNLLTRLVENNSDGTISIAGVNIEEIPLATLRENIGYVMQEPYLFSKTIAENIAIAEKSADMDKIHGAAKTASIHGNIMEFESSYDTLVGQKGITLSGGQKQRVAIARMLISDKPIKVFDDSLSAVDQETDIKIRRALKNELHASTNIFISHRVSTLRNCDKIIVLEGGKIAEQGTHEQLCSKENGIYRDIAKMQE